MDFDPSTNAVLRVEIGRLRAKLAEYYNSYGSKDELVIQLPKGSCSLNFTARENLPIQNKTQTHVVSAWPSVVRDLPSLAVLPFVNLSEESNQNYFSDGMADSLIFEISRLSGIFIISRQSSFSYKQSSKSLSDIGYELGVTYILDGSVQRSSHQLRVTVNLLEASSSGHIWSERYECELQEIFVIQDIIIKNIDKNLQIKLASNEVESFGHEGTYNINAHDALLRGIDCHWKYSPKYIAQARKHFAKAVELNADYSSANAWLARTMLFQWIMRWDQVDGLQNSAYKYAKRAVEINKNLPYPLAIYGWACLWNKQRDNSIAPCRKAVGMDPNNSEAQIFLSQCLQLLDMEKKRSFLSKKQKGSIQNLLLSINLH